MKGSWEVRNGQAFCSWKSQPDYRDSSGDRWGWTRCLAVWILKFWSPEPLELGRGSGGWGVALESRAVIRWIQNDVADWWWDRFGSSMSGHVFICYWLVSMGPVGLVDRWPSGLGWSKVWKWELIGMGWIEAFWVFCLQCMCKEVYIGKHWATLKQRRKAFDPLYLSLFTTTTIIRALSILTNSINSGSKLNHLYISCYAYLLILFTFFSYQVVYLYA